MSVTANFAINTYTLTYTAGANGSITGTSPQTVNHGASGSAVTAVPGTGYHFVDWSDGLAPATRTDTSVAGDITVTAQFAINTYTLTYTAGANGSLTGVSPQTVNHGASGTEVTALPATGYHFVDWSDGVLTATRTDTNVTANINRHGAVCHQHLHPDLHGRDKRLAHGCLAADRQPRRGRLGSHRRAGHRLPLRRLE